MTNEEIVLKIQKGQRHLQADLYLQNEAFLNQLAHRYAFDREDFFDIKQELAIMLFQCADKYNENGGANFISFSYRWLQQACVRFLNQKRLIYVPPDRLPTLRKYAKLKEDGLTDSEIMQAMHLMDELQLREIEREAAATLTPASLSTPIDGEEGEEGTLADTISDPAGQDPFLEIEDALEKVRLSRMISEIGEPHRTVLHLYYFDGLSLESIGKKLGCSKQRISVILRKARDILEGEIRLCDTAEAVAFRASYLGCYKSGKPYSCVEQVVISRCC